ncbi:MAG: AAA family ATPase [Proteobacteria bacterium]|nr:AAA family ATPase [Pseudomonadota bacterium]
MFTKPSSYKDVLLSPEVAQDIEDVVTNKIRFPHHKKGILLHGPYGTGKSTLAALLPEAIEYHRGGINKPVPTHHGIRTGCNSISLLNSLANIAELMPPPEHLHQYIILDEVDNLGASAMSSLKTVIDEGAAVFLMTTNMIDKIDVAVKSRSHLFYIGAAPPHLWAAKAIAAFTAAGKKNIPTQDRVERLVAACNGDTREIIDQLEKMKNGLP